MKENGGNTQRDIWWRSCDRVSVHLQTMAVCNNTSMTNDSLDKCLNSENVFKYNGYIGTYLVVFPLAFVCNTVALVVFYLQSPRRGSASCVIMTNLALSDVSFSLTLPLRLIYYFNDGKWEFSETLCCVCGYSFYLNMYSSIFFLTLLSMLRWFAVSQPLHHRSQATHTRAVLVCLGVWVFVGVCCIPFLFRGRKCRSGAFRCFEPGKPSTWLNILMINYIALAVGFLLPFLIIIICCSSLVRQLMDNSGLHSNQSSNTHHHNRRHSVHLVSMVIVTFLFCFLPYHVIRTLFLHAAWGAWNCNILRVLQQAAVVTQCLATMNSVVNPLLYYYSAKSFRKDLMEARHSLLKRTSSYKLRGSAVRREPEIPTHTQVHQSAL